MAVSVLRGDALAIPLADDTVDLIVTSPPYWALRSYTDSGEHYDGQIGSEPTPTAFLDALIEATTEMVRVLKPSGSLFVNLGDKYAGHSNGSGGHRALSRDYRTKRMRDTSGYGIRTKSLMGMPWRYAIRCIDDLGLILRAEIIWAKPNALPESVRDRVRRSHEQWFHFTLQPRYYSAIDEIRTPHVMPGTKPRVGGEPAPWGRAGKFGEVTGKRHNTGNPMGALPGSVWTIPTEPLRIPDELGVGHHAAFPTELPRRIITGWSPRDVCTACGQGRRPTVERRQVAMTTTTGYVCACPDASAPTTRGVVLDPFGGTGSTALVADVLGRHGITIDMSADYCRLATWRTRDELQRVKVARKAGLTGRAKERRRRSPVVQPTRREQGVLDLELVEPTNEGRLF